MKLHDPDTERAILRLAASARQGRSMEPADGGKNLSSLFLRMLAMMFLAHIFVGLLGAYDDTLRTGHWQSLIICILLMWTTQVAIGGLVDPLERNGRHAVLPNLPISGEHAFRWARQQFFIDHWLKLTFLSFLCAFALHDFSFVAPWELAGTSLLISAIVIASVQVLQQPWLERVHFMRNWTICSLLLCGWMLLLLFTNKKIFRVGGTPEWLADAISLFTWLLPPSWVLPGRFENGGAILALVWIGYGLLLWKKWPIVAAPYLDSPRDFLDSFGDFDEEEDEENEERPEASIETDSAIESPLPMKAPPSPMTILPDGWVERWVIWWIPEKDLPAAGAICDNRPGWTKRTNWMLRILPLWLAAVWIFVRFYPESNRKEGITVWMVAISIGLPVIGFLPASNAISRAYYLYFSSGQILPYFSAAPIPTRTLLRISTRITIARCILLAAIGTPYAWMLQAIFDPTVPLIVFIWLVPAICCIWITARPILVTYRLWKTNRLKNGGGLFVFHSLLVIVGIALAIAAIVSGVLAVFSGLGFIASILDQQASGSFLLGALGGLVLSGLCSRAVFEIYHWQLKRRCLDWVSSP